MKILATNLDYSYLSIYLSIYLSNFLALLQRFMILSEVLYNVHLCKACQCFIPVWGGATLSKIISLGSIQVTWQFNTSTYGNSTFFLHLPYSTYLTQLILQYNTFIQYNLNQVEVWWLGMFRRSVIIKINIKGHK